MHSQTCGAQELICSAATGSVLASRGAEENVDPFVDVKQSAVEIGVTVSQ